MADEMRKELAAAQKRLAEALEKHAAVHAVSSGSRELISTARAKLEQAERAVIDAARHDVDDMVAAKLGQPVPERKSRLVLHDELMAARAGLDAAQRARRDLDARATEAERAVNLGRLKVSETIRALLEGAPEVAGLLDQIKAAEARLIELYHALNAVGGPPEWRAHNSARLVAKAFVSLHPDWNMLPAAEGSEIVPAWREAVSQLQTNAYAPLPGGDTPPRPLRRKLFQAA